MAIPGGINVGQELLNVPMGTMIREMAKAIAEAQWELDKSSMTVAELMSGQRLLRDLNTGALINPMPDGSPRVVDSRVYFGYTYLQGQDSSGNEIWERRPNMVSMMELGFTPTFYQFVDTIIEVKIAIKITGETTTTTTNRQTSQMNQEQTQAETETKVKNESSSSYSGTSYWGYGYGWGYGYNSSSNSSSNTQTSTDRTDTKTNTVQTSQVDASYSNKYGYSVEGSSLLRTKLAPVPPPAILLERIQEVMQQERQLQARMLEVTTNPDAKPLEVRPLQAGERARLTTAMEEGAFEEQEEDASEEVVVDDPSTPEDESLLPNPKPAGSKRKSTRRKTGPGTAQS